LLLASGLAVAVGWKPNTPPLPVAGSSSPSISWTHRMRLDANYDVYWSLSETDVTFQVQVRTLGYVIFGLSPTGLFQDADLVVGWIQNGRPRFQVNTPCLFFLLKSLLFSFNLRPLNRDAREPLVCAVWCVSMCLLVRVSPSITLGRTLRIKETREAGRDPFSSSSSFIFSLHSVTK
jgi:hypothetical protein